MIHRETFATSCFHRDTEPKSISAEKETVRDVTEKRLLHRIFIATQSPCRLSFEVFSKRLQIVIFTLRDLVLNAVYNATADV